MLLGALLFGCRVAADPDGGLCPAWSGLDAEGEGRLFEDFATEAEWVESVARVEGDAITVEREGAVAEYRCDEDGAWATALFEEDGASWTRWTWDPAWLWMPRHLEVGTTWTADAAYNLLHSDGSEVTGSSATRFEVRAETETWVPAGTWTTLQVAVIGEPAAGEDADIAGIVRRETDEDTRYFARGHGIVLTDDYQLVAVGTVE